MIKKNWKKPSCKKSCVSDFQGGFTATAKRRVIVGDRLGGGAFGDVHIASFKKSPNYKVAVKFIRYQDNASKVEMDKVDSDLDKEAEVMKNLRHTNVVSFIGWVNVRKLKSDWC